MANQGWGKLTGGPYKRTCPGLCPFCVHLQIRERGWRLNCAALGKRLSNPHTAPGKCDAFERGEQRLTDTEIAELYAEAKDYQEWRRSWAAR